MSSLILLIASFLQPSGLAGCGEKPRPSCLMPDIPALEWQGESRRYSWPLEVNEPPLARITYHRQPEVYGSYPPTIAGVMLEYCLVDEGANTADCWSEWEYQTDAICTVDRWGWIAKPTPMGGRLVREDVREYHEHTGRVQVYLWDFREGVGYLPNMGLPTTPRPSVSFQADRTQVIRRGPTTGFSPLALLFVRNAGSPKFRSGFDFNSGITDRLPAADDERGACTASFIFATNWCAFAPSRPECPSQAQGGH